MRRLRKSVRKRIRWFFIVAAAQLFLLCLCHGIVKQTTMKKYETLLAEKEQLITAAERVVYMTTEPVNAGEEFTEHNVEKRYVLSEQDADTLAVNAIGSVACVDLPAGIIINTAVCDTGEYDAAERKCTFQGIFFSECFEAYDLVDVRIRYGNGENYCVLREKRLLPSEQDGVCCFSLNETEQLLMSGAEFDAEMYDGARLYLVGIQSEWENGEEVSMFLPAEQVLLQLRELDRNKEEFYEKGQELRNALEARLSEHRKKRKDGLI